MSSCNQSYDLFISLFSKPKVLLKYSGTQEAVSSKAINPNKDGPPATPISDGEKHIFSLKTRTYTSLAAIPMIDMYFRPSPKRGFTVYVTQRSRKSKSSPIRRAL